MRIFRFANHLESGIDLHAFKGFCVVRKEHNTGVFLRHPLFMGLKFAAQLLPEW